MYKQIFDSYVLFEIPMNHKNNSKQTSQELLELITLIKKKSMYKYQVPVLLAARY